MIKIIFSDMDGTLLDENAQLPAEFDEVMAELKKRHVIFAPTSGRQYFALTYQLAKYKDEFMFLAENGTLTCYQGKELFSNTIDKGIYYQVLAKALELDTIYPVVCGKKGAYVQKKWQKWAHEMDKYYTSYTYVDSFESIDDEFIKLALADNDGENAEQTIYAPMQELNSGLAVTLSSNIWVDVMNPTANKGWAVQQVQRLMGFKPEECACFGDYLNDYEMMSTVHYSYAMANAHPKLKEAARFQCKSNAEHGVMEQIKQFIKDGLI